MPSHKCLCLIPVIYGFLIIIIINCIFTRGFTDIRTNLLDQLYSFNYPRTYIELYFLILFDSFLLIVCSWMKCFQKFKCSRLILIVFQLFIYAYSLSKFLIFYEWKNVRNPTSPYQLDRFDYLAIIFIPLFALGGIFIWILVFRIVKIKQIDPEREHLINGTTRGLYTEETDPLIVESKEIFR